MKRSKNLTAWITALAFGGALVAAPVMAVDNETSITSDRSKNPITGTVKTTKRYKNKKTNPDGSVSEAHTTNTVKEKTDGSVDKKVEHESTEHKE